MGGPGAKTMSRPSVVLVAKRSSWTSHVERSPDPLVLDLLRRQDPTVARMKAAHDAHEHALAAVRAALAAARADVLFIDDLRQPFSTDGASLVLTVGGDGTLLSASHQIAGCPVLGVNSAPGISVGFFSGADASSIGRLLPLALAGALPGVDLTRMEVLCNERVISRRVLNDALLCHACPAATSRYILELDGEPEEEHRSSGLWVGPAAGSTAALRSAGGEVLPLDSEDLQFVVREPYIPAAGPYRLTRRVLAPGQALRVRSKMYDGALFLDGTGRQSQIKLGDRVEFRRSDEPLRLLGLTADRQRASAVG